MGMFCSNWGCEMEDKDYILSIIQMLFEYKTSDESTMDGRGSPNISTGGGKGSLRLCSGAGCCTRALPELEHSHIRP